MESDSTSPTFISQSNLQVILWNVLLLMLVFLCKGVARPVLVVPWIVIQELDSLKVCQFLLHVFSLLYMFLSGVFG